jgi:hypothetical protein
MDKLTETLDKAGAPPAADGPEARIAALAREHPDNIHLNTFDPQHFLGLSDDEKDMFCWCLSTDLADLRNRAESSGGEEKVEMPLGALGAAAVALCLVGVYGKAAVMPLLMSAVVLSILSAFVFVSDGRSAEPEELQEERDGMALPVVPLASMALQGFRRRLGGGRQ